MARPLLWFQTEKCKAAYRFLSTCLSSVQDHPALMMSCLSFPYSLAASNTTPERSCVRHPAVRSLTLCVCRSHGRLIFWPRSLRTSSRICARNGNYRSRARRMTWLHACSAGSTRSPHRSCSRRHHSRGQSSRRRSNSWRPRSRRHSNINSSSSSKSLRMQTGSHCW